MANNQGFSDEEMAKMREFVELREKARTSLMEYKDVMEKLAEIRASERHYHKELDRFQKKENDLAKERLKLENELSKAQGAQAIKAATDKLDKHKEEEDLLERKIRFTKQEIKHNQLLGGVLSDNLNTNNFMLATYGSIRQTLGYIGKQLYEQKDYLLEQQKAVKTTELQMGLLSKQSAGYRNNLYNASLSTNQIGVDTKALGQMQATYSQEIGRTTLLTEAGNQAMAELAMGTVLGTENAAQFAANMDQFGYSVESARDFMEEAMNISTSMGINSAATTENLQKSLEVAQRYNFAGGVKGITKMATTAAKLKMEISSIEGIAEKVFNPEGAIEMAAQLSVLGGSWGRIADPFSFMYKARNDMAGLTEDIARAAAGTAQFNEETGEFEIASMELHRLRQVSEATGIQMDELTKSARQAAKFSKIKAEVVGDFDDDIMEFISSKGRFDKESGEFKININGKDQFVSDLHMIGEAELKRLAEENATLQERAKQAQTFDDQWNNILNQFKATILPGFDIFADQVLKGLLEFSEWMKDENVLEGIQSFGKMVGDIAGAMVKFATNNPWMTLIGLMVGKAASWAMRGRIMGLAFNKVARVNGGGSGGNGSGIGGKMSKAGKIGYGAGGILGLAGGAAYMYNATRENPNDQTGKNLDVLGGALSGAGTGAMIGTMIAPGIGTAIGGVAGGLIGGVGQYMMQDRSSNPAMPTQNTSPYQDFVARPGQKPISFSSADTLIGMKKGGGIDNFLSKQENSSDSSGTVNVNFNRPLKVEGTLKLQSGGQSTDIDLNNPILIRELSRMVQEELTISLNGKRNPNPVN